MFNLCSNFSRKIWLVKALLLPHISLKIFLFQSQDRERYAQDHPRDKSYRYKWNNVLLGEWNFRKN